MRTNRLTQRPLANACVSASRKDTIILNSNARRDYIKHTLGVAPALVLRFNDSFGSGRFDTLRAGRASANARRQHASPLRFRSHHLESARITSAWTTTSPNSLVKRTRATGMPPTVCSRPCTPICTVSRNNGCDATAGSLPLTRPRGCTRRTSVWQNGIARRFPAVRTS